MEKKEDLQENSENLNQEEDSKTDENLSKLDSEIKESNNNEETKELTLEDKINELEDKVARTMAEMENQRRRFEKEKEEAFEFGGFNFARESLLLLDNIERAIVSFKNDEKLKNNKDLDKIINGIDVIKKDLVSIFKKNGIEAIECKNKKFDPNFHQAMLEVDDNTNEEGVVVQEIQRGYMMKSRLLRPSLVGVAKKRQVEEKNQKLPSDDKKAEKKG